MGQMTKVGKTATDIRTEDGQTVVRYHRTDVVRFDQRTVTLNCGGWRTATTKTRMNQAARQFGLGYHVWQKSWSWYVDLPDGRTVPFDKDTLTFDR